MRNIKRLARFIIELILAISIIGFVFIYTLSNTVLNEAYMLDKLKTTDYYGQVYDLLQSNFENYIQQSGLDEDILKEIITKEQLEEDTIVIFNCIYDGLDINISTDKLEKNLKKNISKKIGKKSLNKETEKAIDDFVKEICKEYKATIVNSDYEKQINTWYRTLFKYFRLGQKIFAISVGASFICLILLNIKRIYRIATNTGIAFLASGVILTISNIYINTKVKVQYLTILNEPISKVVRSTSEDILSKILKYGILLLATGLILIVVANAIHKFSKLKNYTIDYDD